MSVLARDAMTETFFDLEGLIKSVARKFADRYRMDRDDCISMAYEAFVESFGGGFNPKRGTFTTYVMTRVRHKLLEAHRTFMRRIILGKITEYDPLLLEATNGDQRVSDLLDDLSKDARIVANLVIDAPREIVHTMIVDNHNPIKTRKAVVEYLGDIGWMSDRITESFSEIAEAL